MKQFTLAGTSIFTLAVVFTVATLSQNLNIADTWKNLGHSGVQLLGAVASSMTTSPSNVSLSQTPPSTSARTTNSASVAVATTSTAVVEETATGTVSSWLSNLLRALGLSSNGTSVYGQQEASSDTDTYYNSSTGKYVTVATNWVSTVIGDAAQVLSKGLQKVATVAASASNAVASTLSSIKTSVQKYLGYDTTNNTTTTSNTATDAVVSCSTAANSCGMTAVGTIASNGTCSATTPNDSLCPTPNITSFTAASAQVQERSSTTLSWKTENATSCTLAGNGFSENVSVVGSRSTGAIRGETSFTLTCKGGSGIVSSTITATSY